MNIIQMNDVAFYISCDLKMVNIIYGIQSHSSKHPCCWCNVSSDNLSECESLRSCSTLKDMPSLLLMAQITTLEKNFANVIYSPLINMDNSVLILDVIPPMELNLLLGIVNHFFKNFSDLWPGAKEWPAELHIQFQPYHGGHFKGNDWD